MTETFYIWMLAYAAPAFLAGAAVKILPRSKARLNIRNGIIMCTALGISIMTTQYFISSSDRAFPWVPNYISIACLVASLGISYKLMGLSSLAYWGYCLLQELTLLSITYLLLAEFSLPVIFLLVVPFFVWCHPLYVGPHWRLRIAMFAGWGIISLAIFSVLKDMYIIAAIHSVFGAWFISKSILYSEVYEDVVRYAKA